jgi:hypothetical protein
MTEKERYLEPRSGSAARTNSANDFLFRLTDAVTAL